MRLGCVLDLSLASEPRAMNPISDQIPQFIVTSGRSGSTMLARMLQRHPELVCMSDLIEPVGDVPFIDTERIVSSQDFLATLQAPSLPERIRFWRAQPTDELLHLPEHDADVSLLLTYALPFLQPDDPEGLLRDLCDAIGMREPATMAAHLFASFAWLRDRFGGTRWVERTGGSLPHAKKLVDTFPQGRFIHLHRDPAEVAISMQTGSFFRLYHLLEDNPALDRWDWNVVPEPAVLAAMLDRWEVAACQAWRALPNDQFLRIRYEDLMADGPHHLLRVLAFLLERPISDQDRSWAAAEAASLRPAPLRLPQLDSRQRALGPHQRVNHYPGIIPLVRKDELHDHLAFANADEGRPWRFPRSFSMPDELDELRAAANADPDRVWIVKERDGSMGRGMYLVHDIEKLEPDPETIVQEYIDDPMVFPDFGNGLTGTQLGPGRDIDIVRNIVGQREGCPERFWLCSHALDQHTKLVDGADGLANPTIDFACLRLDQYIPQGGCGVGVEVPRFIGPEQRRQRSGHLHRPVGRVGNLAGDAGRQSDKLSASLSEALLTNVIGNDGVRIRGDHARPRFDKVLMSATNAVWVLE
ncbi:Tubulin polyglutamylase TTLL6 [Nymphon striatum]|nr:Tubulin polyglutamylase TTLL6 [Nymphon striatum]